MEMWTVWGQTGMWDCGWAHLSEAHDQAGQGCGELDPGPAVALLGQGLMAPGSWHRVLVHGQGRGSPTGMGRDSQGQQCLKGTADTWAKPWISACPGFPAGQARGSLKEWGTWSWGELQLQPHSWSGTNPTIAYTCSVCSTACATCSHSACPFQTVGCLIHCHIQTSLLQLCTDSLHPSQRFSHHLCTARDIKPASACMERTSEVSSSVLFLYCSVIISLFSLLIHSANWAIWKCGRPPPDALLTFKLQKIILFFRASRSTIPPLQAPILHLN